jgi:hypothetical protein
VAMLPISMGIGAKGIAHERVPAKGRDTGIVQADAGYNRRFARGGRSGEQPAAEDATPVIAQARYRRVQKLWRERLNPPPKGHEAFRFQTLRQKDRGAPRVRHARVAFGRPS